MRGATPARSVGSMKKVTHATLSPGRGGGIPIIRRIINRRNVVGSTRTQQLASTRAGPGMETPRDNSSDNDNSSGQKAPPNINAGVGPGRTFPRRRSIRQKVRRLPTAQRFVKTANETPSYSLTITFSAI